MKYIIVSLGIWIGTCSGGWAQVPGYEGKRAILDLSLDVSPAIRIASRRDLPPYLFNVQPLIDVEYVMSRRLSFGAHIQPLLAGVMYDREGGVHGKALIRGLGLSFSTRLYSFKRKGNIAPLGPYREVEVFYVNYWLNDKDKRFYDDGRTWLGRYDDLGVGITLGERRMVGDGLSLQYGVRFATILGTLGGGNNEDRIYLKEIATDRLQGYFFVNFHVGLGILLF